MVAGGNKRTRDLLLLLNGVLLAVVINQVASLYFFRLDLTEEQRFTIKAPTIALLSRLGDDVYVDVYLEGDLNAEFRRLRKSVREMLEEFRTYSRNKLHYQFEDPLAAKGANAQQEQVTFLAGKGLKPMNIIDNRDGRRTEKIVFPGALVSFGGLQVPVMLLKDQVGGAQQDINRAIEGLEFELADAIHQLTVTDRKRVGFAGGHGELDSLQLASLTENLLPLYDVDAGVNLANRVMPSQYDVLVVARPQDKYSELEKYNVDQFILAGGKAIFFLDALHVNLDSLAQGNYYAFPMETGLNDLLFKYGVRLNQDLVQDLVCLRFPVVTGTVNGNPQITPIEWPYFPLGNQYASHPITRNLDATAFRFVGSLDSVRAKGIRKTPLIVSSRYSRKVNGPLKISVNDLRKEITPQNFSTAGIPMVYLLEGRFHSLFENRFLPDGADSTARRAEGEFSRMVIAADGDLPGNEISRRTGAPLDLGFDPVTNHTFANKELITNMIAYLTDDQGLITTRNRQVMMRPLDKERIRSDRAYWQTINLGLPLVVLVLLGLGKLYLRHRRYGQQTPYASHK